MSHEALIVKVLFLGIVACSGHQAAACLTIGVDSVAGARRARSSCCVQNLTFGWHFIMCYHIGVLPCGWQCTAFGTDFTYGTAALGCEGLDTALTMD
jgi:hypothetical protein